MISLDIAKEYLRIDDGDEILQLSIDYAEQQWRNAIDDYDKKISQDNFCKLLKIPMLLTIQCAYDERSYSTDKKSTSISKIISNALLQANFCYDV